MRTAGIDIGSTTTKVAVVEDGVLKGWRILPTGVLPARAAEEAFRELLRELKLEAGALDVVATTGYGRRLVDFGDLVLTEIKACAAGVLFMVPREAGVHTIIDVGGQDTKVLALDDAGGVEDFSMNDKCAAGTGRFLQVLADKLGMEYQEFVEEAGRSTNLIQMNATCAVFAESEVIGLLARGASKADIAAAAHHAISTRVASMVRRCARRGGYAFVGGGARNHALVKAVEEALNAPVHVPEHCQVVTALGAAVCAAAKKAGASEI